MITQGYRNKEIILEFKNTGKNAEIGLRQGLHRLGNLLTKRARKLIRKGPKTGRFYRIKGRKRLHRASAPGQPPANLFGNLARSIGYQIIGRDMYFETRGNENGQPVQPGGVSYGRWLDSDEGVIKRRPFLSRTVREFENTANNILNNEVLKQI